MRWPLLVNLAEFPFIVVELNVLPRTATRAKISTYSMYFAANEAPS
jgi:hypothetical protein